MPPVTLRRIVSTWWFRFRRAIEDTPTVLLVMTPIACARSCAAMALELKNEGTIWPATTAFITPEEKYVPTPDERTAKHFSLVIAEGRDTHDAAVPNHAHFLKASTIRVNRERPVEWSNHIARFTPEVARASCA
jgi:hypothetical protein